MSAAILRLLLILLLRVILNRQLRMAVFPAGPQPRALAGSVPRRTSTASSGRQRSPADLNCERWLAAFPAGPQPRVPLGSVPRHTSNASSL